MSDNENFSPPNKRRPWNKGKLIGARPPLRPKHAIAPTDPALACFSDIARSSRSSITRLSISTNDLGGAKATEVVAGAVACNRAAMSQTGHSRPMQQ